MKENFIWYVSIPIGFMALVFIEFTILNILHVRKTKKEFEKTNARNSDKTNFINDEIANKFRKL